MTHVHKPHIVLPKYSVSHNQMVSVLSEIYKDHPHKKHLIKMLNNMEIDNRQFILPLEKIIAAENFTHRSTLYHNEINKISKQVVEECLELSQMTPKDIDLIISVSCTGFMMPSFGDYLINDMGFNLTVKKLPVAQTGCAGGAFALAKAHEYLKAYPNHKVLIVAIEFSSLNYQPRLNLSNAVCTALFGDAAAACIVSGDETKKGLKILDTLTYTLPNSENFIMYEVGDFGFYFKLDKEVMYSIEKMSPIIKEFAIQNGSTSKDLNFCLAHTGGKRILDHLVKYSEIDKNHLRFSRDSLKNLGNVSSVSVLDVISRWYSSGNQKLFPEDNLGLITGIGPGVTLELIASKWM